MERVTEWMRRRGIRYKEGVSGGRLTTFGSGGAVRVVAEPKADKEIADIIAFLTTGGVPYRVLGGGSNVLLPDEGYDGVILRTARLETFSIRGTVLTVGAGVRLPVFSRRCAALALSGAEFAEGIPGTVGGAVYMNASAFGSGISDILRSVRLLYGGEIVTLPASALPMGYHRGGLPRGAVLLGATFRLTTGDEDGILERMRTFAARRAATQPRERSAGSVFARAGETPAALLIERTGLKGTRVGGAELSRKHCNFIVDMGGATTTEYHTLAERVRREVQRITGITLAYEVEFIKC